MRPRQSSINGLGIYSGQTAQSILGTGLCNKSHQGATYKKLGRGNICDPNQSPQQHRSAEDIRRARVVTEQGSLVLHISFEIVSAEYNELDDMSVELSGQAP